MIRTWRIASLAATAVVCCLLAVLIPATAQQYSQESDQAFDQEQVSHPSQYTRARRERKKTGLPAAFRQHLIRLKTGRQVIADLRQLLDLQFDATNNNTDANVMKRASTLRQLRDPQTMTRLAQMARQRPPPPPQQQLPPGRFNNFRYPPPPPSTFMGAPPPPPFLNQQPGRPIQQDPGLFFGAHQEPPRNNERECLPPAFNFI